MGLLIAGVVTVGLALLVLLLVAVIPREPTGVSRSLLLLEHRIDPSSVPRHQLPASERFIAPLLRRTQRLGAGLSPSGTYESLGRRLDRAGNPGSWTPDRILGAKGAGLVLGLLLGMLIIGPSASGVVLSLGLAVMLFFAPDLALYNAALRRKDLASKSLAEALDMLTISVEAGQAFDAAIGHVARTITGPVAGEFARVLSEIQLGRSRSDALHDVGNRLAVPELKNFVTAIAQADRFGLPIAQVLREQTSAMRVTRRQRAEEKAQKVTVKIIFPLILCIFPAIFVVIIGPGVIRIIAALSRF